MKVARATGALLERSDELARIESALAEARTGRGRFVVVEGPAGIGKTALLAAARTRRQRAECAYYGHGRTEMENNFAFGVVRQLFEPPLAEASELERADLLQAAAGIAAGTLGLAGARPAEGPLPQASILPSRSSTASTGCARTSPPWARSAWSSTMRTGQTLRLSVTWPSCSRGSKSWRSRSSSRPALRERGQKPSCLRP